MLINRSFIIANLLVLTALVYISVGIFYDAISSRFTVTRAIPVKTMDTGAQEAVQETIQPESFYKVIMDRDLFKTTAVPVKKVIPKFDPDKLEETKLQLKLWGTVSGDEKRAYAVIEESQTRLQNLFRVGDTVQNATVKMILREKVVLSFNGKDEVLTMEDAKTGAGGRPMPGRPMPTTSAVSRPVSGALRSQKITLRRSIIEDSVRDISKLMTQIQIRPHLEDGVPTGLSLSNIQPNSIFRRMGLRNGDIITGVDGQNIQSVDDALKLYENLRTSTALNVDIKRRGRDRKIEYQIR